MARKQLKILLGVVIITALACAKYSKEERAPYTG